MRFLCLSAGSGFVVRGQRKPFTIENQTGTKILTNKQGTCQDPVIVENFWGGFDGNVRVSGSPSCPKKEELQENKARGHSRMKRAFCHLRMQFFVLCLALPQWDGWDFFLPLFPQQPHSNEQRSGPTRHPPSSIVPRLPSLILHPPPSILPPSHHKCIYRLYPSLSALANISSQVCGVCLYSRCGTPGNPGSTTHHRELIHPLGPVDRLLTH